MTMMLKPPKADGLYDPRFEHDACGVAMVARLDNVPSHDVIIRALEALDNLEHRGAEGADVNTGDGAGIVVKIPDAFFREVCPFELPEAGGYGVGVCFLPRDPALRRKIEELLELNVRVEGQRVLGWRDVPVDAGHVGETADRSRPHIRQLFIGGREGLRDRPGRVRAQALRDPPDRRAGGRPGLLRAELLVAHLRLQGHADRAPGDRVLPGPAGRALHLAARARALAVLDEHVPELGAGAAVPRDRPQRRDQHADGQHQLDARPRELARQRALRPRPAEGHADRAAGRLGLGDVRQRPGAADAQRPLAAARRDDDGAGGLQGPHRPLG